MFAQRACTAERRAVHEQVVTGKTGRLQSGGSFMLGGEQDCVGGCTDRQQAFYGLLDEVSICAACRIML